MTHLNTSSASGRWTLTMTSPNTGVAVNIRFASEESARAYQEELMARNEQSDDDQVDDDVPAKPLCLLWFDPAANPSVNIPSLPNPSRGLRSALDSAEAYDPNDF